MSIERGSEQPSRAAADLLIVKFSHQPGPDLHSEPRFTLRRELWGRRHDGGEVEDD